jgi:hypothetical protein
MREGEPGAPHDVYTDSNQQKGGGMIGGLRRLSYTTALFALTIVVLAGCKASGGGYITSDTGEGKATFAFNGKCTNTTLENGDVAAVTKGQLQYNDRSADVKFHADLAESEPLPGTSTPCEDFDEEFTDEDTDEFFGFYRVSGGPKEAEGDVLLEVTDAGEPGINGDEVAIFLTAFEPGGTYDGYFNSGTVQGGNVQVH